MCYETWSLAINAEADPGASLDHTMSQSLHKCYRSEFMKEIWWRIEKERVCDLQCWKYLLIFLSMNLPDGQNLSFFVFLLKDYCLYDLNQWAIRLCLSGLDLPPVCRARIRTMVCVKAVVAVCEVPLRNVKHLRKPLPIAVSLVLHFGWLRSYLCCVMGCVLWGEEDLTTTKEQQQ